MEQVKTLDDLSSLSENQIIAGENLTLKNSSITFQGKGNILYIEAGVTLDGCNIVYTGDHALIYLSQSNRPYRLTVTSNCDTTLFFGKNNSFNFNRNLTLFLTEHQNIIIGNGNTFSYDIRLRTAESHPIYRIDTKERTHLCQSVFIGDHVWLAADCLVLAGTKIGSGAILAEKSAVYGDSIPSNSYWGGNPAVQMETGVFFTNDFNLNWNEAQSTAAKVRNTNEFIYCEDGITRMSYYKIDTVLKCQPTVEARLDQVQLLLANCTDKNRFFIPCPDTPQAQKPASASAPSWKKFFRKK